MWAQLLTKHKSRKTAPQKCNALNNKLSAHIIILNPWITDAKTWNMNRSNVDGWEQCVIHSQYLLSALTLSKSTLVQSFSTHFLQGTGSWHKLIQIIKQNNRRLIPSGLNKHLLPLFLNWFNSFSCKKNTIQSLNTPCNLSFSLPL